MLYYIAELRSVCDRERTRPAENALVETLPAGRTAYFRLRGDAREGTLAVGIAMPEAPSREWCRVLLRGAAWLQGLPRRYDTRFTFREATLSTLCAYAVTGERLPSLDTLEDFPTRYAHDGAFGLERVRAHLYPDGHQRPSARECVMPNGWPAVPLYLAAKSDSPSLGAAVHEALLSRGSGAVGANGRRCYVIAGLPLFLLEAMGKITEAWYAASLIGSLRLTLVEPAPWDAGDFGLMLLNVRGTSVGMMVSKSDLSESDESVRTAVRQWAEADTQGPLFVCVDTQGAGPEAVATILSWLPDVPVTVVLDDNPLTPVWTSSKNGIEAADRAVAALCAPGSRRATPRQGGTE